jgi:hypothetical protein
MGFDTSNLPHWWVETHNSVKASFGVLLSLTLISTYHYFIILMTIISPAKYPPERIKFITKPFFYYQISMVAVYFSSNMFTSIFSWVLMFLWFKIHCLFTCVNEEMEYRFRKMWRWMHVLQFFFWWGVLVSFFFEFARP